LRDRASRPDKNGR